MRLFPRRSEQCDLCRLCLWRGVSKSLCGISESQLTLSTWRMLAPCAAAPHQASIRAAQASISWRNVLMSSVTLREQQRARGRGTEGDRADASLSVWRTLGSEECVPPRTSWQTGGTFFFDPNYQRCFFPPVNPGVQGGLSSTARRFTSPACCFPYESHRWWPTSADLLHISLHLNSWNKSESLKQSLQLQSVHRKCGCRAACDLFAQHSVHKKLLVLTCFCKLQLKYNTKH